MAQLGIGAKLITAFIMLIIGVVLIGVIASNGLTVTTKTVESNETFDISDAVLDGTINVTDADAVHSLVERTAFVADCPVSNVVYTFANGTAFTETTDYTVSDTAGTITLVNSTNLQSAIADNNSTLASYQYCNDYLNLSWGRTLLNLIGGFLALAMVAVAIGLFFSIAKETGIA